MMFCFSARGLSTAHSLLKSNAELVDITLFTFANATLYDGIGSRKHGLSLSSEGLQATAVMFSSGWTTAHWG